MPDLTKIATCSFCGSRSVLHLREFTGHKELSCGSCAAPLHEMKALKVAPQIERPVRSTPIRAIQNRPKRRRSIRKPVWHRMLEEVWDELEDLLD